MRVETSQHETVKATDPYVRRFRALREYSLTSGITPG